MKLITAFGAGLLAMAAVFGVIAVVDDGGGDTSSNTQNVATATERPDGGNDGSASNIQVDEDCKTAAEIYEEVSPSIIQIDISGAGLSGTGTGIILDEEGYILTNNHVIASGDTISVTFGDGETAQATGVGTDPQNDLAIIKIDPADHELVPATLGDSSELRVGDSVLALGSPFNLQGTLTQGIVSALDRAYSEGNGTRPIRGMIQTDAAINPGNSGGPLINCYGEVIGVNTLLENPTGERVNVGVGFAVAINTAKAELDDLKSGEEIQHAWLGIAGLDLTPALQEELDLTVDEGVYVTFVNPGSPADDAGLIGAFTNEFEATNATDPEQGGDVITAADGEDMTGIEKLAGYLANEKRPGDTVDLTVIRDGEEMTITATLAQWPSA
jgi:S1-C subfamily serine protease